MITIPAIEIRNGACPAKASCPVDGEFAVLSPMELARSWAHAGFRQVHVADLDSTTGGRANAALVEDVIRDGAAGVQAVVGSQSMEAVDRLMDAGAERIVLSADVVDDSAWIEGVAQAYPGSVIVATDVRERRLVTRGWVRNVPVDVFDLVQELDGLPLGGLLVSVANGGGYAPADLALLEDIAEAFHYPLLAAGGISTMNDLRALEHRGVSGVVLGTILYSGALDARAVAREFSE
jgi:phosphoribosylformimino-5-aminoimidazole carboxamide ribotide isomerase